jgi:uncharacterized protein YqhQ
MLKNDRVKHMTKMAMYEKQNKNDLRIVTEYRRKDYISMSRILAFIFGSIAFAVFYFGVVVLFLYNRFSNIHTRLIVLILLLGILLYVFFLYVHMRRVSKFADRKYRHSKNVYQKWRVMLRELEDMYDDEEREQESD